MSAESLHFDSTAAGLTAARAAVDQFQAAMKNAGLFVVVTSDGNVFQSECLCFRPDICQLKYAEALRRLADQIEADHGDHDCQGA
ncbi:hypothetical protein IU485_28345 [Nocardia cyriacigeorgica]|uniref:hypothetical protein n=1 Tax=Nocardia cyriacigeorgica TaxID=135487 RepID=UPI001894869D|nr:hypothetical protein [Nocardia cyriacigeorgica]MBF6085284.1 hypothetical protein [Nocardia cyriacigeorgica]